MQTPQAQAANPAADRRSPLGLVVVLLSVLGFLLLCFRLRRFFTDDAWISIRYAESLGGGHGFVWNPGGERAEGFSNPLLVYGEALVHFAGLPAVTFARVLGVVCAAACIVLVYLRGRDVVGETAARTAAVLTGLCPPLALWAVGGLETTLTALVITAAVLEVSRRDGGRAVVAGVLLALLPWLRPEGLLVALPLAVLSEARGVLGTSTRRRSLVRLGLIGGLPLLSQGVLEVLRLTVYGHLLPNSVIYKSGTGGLFGVPGKFLAQAAPVVVLAAAGAILATRDRRWLIAVPPTVYLLGSIGTLDSINTYSRFFLPTWPALTLLAGIAVGVVAAATPNPRGGLAAAVVVAGCGVLAVGLLPGNVRAATKFTNNYMNCRAEPRIEAARWLRNNTQQDALVSISDAGLVPARSGGRTFVDQFMLHEPLIQETGPVSGAAKAGTVFDRDPDVIVLASRSRDPFAGHYHVDREIYADSRLDGYQLAHVAGAGARCNYWLFILTRR